MLLNVRDVRTGEWFVCTVDGAHALDAFRHPFAYAARRHDRTSPMRELVPDAWAMVVPKRVAAAYAEPDRPPAG